MSDRDLQQQALNNGPMSDRDLRQGLAQMRADRNIIDKSIIPNKKFDPTVPTVMQNNSQLNNIMNSGMNKDQMLAMQRYTSMSNSENNRINNSNYLNFKRGEHNKNITGEGKMTSLNQQQNDNIIEQQVSANLSVTTAESSIYSPNNFDILISRFNKQLSKSEINTSRVDQEIENLLKKKPNSNQDIIKDNDKNIQNNKEEREEVNRPNTYSQRNIGILPDSTINKNILYIDKYKNEFDIQNEKLRKDWEYIEYQQKLLEQKKAEIQQLLNMPQQELYDQHKMMQQNVTEDTDDKSVLSNGSHESINHKLEYIDIDINSQDNAPSGQYNNYIVNLNDSYTIMSSTLLSYDIPPNLDNITDNNNKLYYTIGDNDKLLEKCITVAPGCHDIEHIINVISKGFNENNDNIVIKMNRHNHITFKHNDGNEFAILNKEDSINSILGYIQDIYSGTNVYRSYEVHKVKKVDKIYLHLFNLLDHKPFAVIDMNNTSCECNIVT